MSETMEQPGVSAVTALAALKLIVERASGDPSWADYLALQEASDRLTRALVEEGVAERIARVIDPEAWKLWPDGGRFVPSDIPAGQARVRAPSLAKAHSCLELLAALAVKS